MRRFLIGLLSWVLAAGPALSECPIIDGQVNTSAQTLTSVWTTPLTTARANDLLVAWITTTNFPTGGVPGIPSSPTTVMSISGGAVSWTRRFPKAGHSSDGTINNTTGDCGLFSPPCYFNGEVWTGQTTAPLSAVTITATLAQEATAVIGGVIAFNPIPTPIFDTNASLPTFGSQANGTLMMPATTPTYSTTGVPALGVAFCVGQNMTGTGCQTGNSNGWTSQAWTSCGFLQPFVGVDMTCGAFIQEFAATNTSVAVAPTQPLSARTWLIEADALTCAPPQPAAQPPFVWIHE